MKPIRLSDCSPSLREAINRSVKGASSSGRVRGRKSAGKPSETSCRSKAGHSRVPNRTEQAYNVEFLGGKGMYEAVTFRLPGGSRYTPDWVTFTDKGRMVVHEVKGAHRFHSESRAVMAWRECRAAFPHVDFVWAKKEKSGNWRIEG